MGESPQEKKRGAYSNNRGAIFYLQLYQCNLTEVHEALSEKTKAEQGSHNLPGPLIPTLVSASLHQTPLEAIVFED